MFDKTLFDRNAFDRSVSSDGIAFAMFGSSKLEVNLMVKTPTDIKLTGEGSLIPNIQLRQNIVNSFIGSGTLRDLTILLRRSTTIPLTGGGVLDANFVIRVPITGVMAGSGGASIDARMIMHQNIHGDLYGTGTLIPQPVFKTELSCNIHGGGEMSPLVNLWLPLDVVQKGQGAFILRRLGVLNENVIELIDINLLPGETVTIDTDLLQVLIGSVEDVSSITTESVFFELNPGENEIVINANSDSVMEVVAIWQNRWL